MHLSNSVAVIDIGTNSIKFIIAEKSEIETMRILHQETIELRIGTGISTQKLSFSNETMTQLITVLSNLKMKAEGFRAHTIRIVATSAVREANNQNELAQKIKATLKVPLEILSGNDEAYHIGNAIHLDPKWKATKTLNFIDLGGGSMECITIHNHRIEQAISLPLGAVRLTELFFPDSDTIFKTNTISSIFSHVEKLVKESNLYLDPKIPLLGSGGAFFILQQNLKGKTHIQALEVLELAKKTGAESLEIRIKKYNIPPKRADVFPIALCTLYAFMHTFNIEAFYPSTFNLKFGILKEMLQL